MSWLSLALGLMGAALVANMFRPRATGPARVPSFLAGFLASELALPLAILLSLATLALLASGAGGAWAGRLGLVLTLLAVAGLAVAVLEAHGARRTARRALRAALGPDYEDAILPEWRAKLGDRLDLRRALAPVAIRPREVERVRDVRYARARGVDLRLDVYRHRARPGGCPVLLYVHGGGWSSGSKDRRGLPLLHHLAARGWVCVSADYRLSPHATFPEHLIDLKRVLRWIRGNAAGYGGDPGFVVAAGGSAGAHLATLLALTQGDPEYQPGFEDADTRVAACVSLYGVYDLADRHGVFPGDTLARHLERDVLKAARHEAPREYEKGSPIARLSADAPPLLAVHGDRDSIAPVEGARRFVEAFRARAAAPIAYAELRGAHHAFDLLLSIRTQYVLHAIERFVAHRHADYCNTRLDLLDDLEAAREAPPGGVSERAGAP